jgi:hypothetical protein
MPNLRHLFPRETAATEQYTYAQTVKGASFKLPPRDRVPHGSKLITDLHTAEQRAADAVAGKPEAERPKGVVLQFESDPSFKLQLRSLEVRQSGIELRNSRIDTGEHGAVMRATVFVPDGKLGYFVRKFEAYCSGTDTRSGKPKNQQLAESITAIRLAALESFWTDAGRFPDEGDQPLWWEVWLREASNPHDVADQFRQSADAVGIQVGARELRFPERRVLLTRATVNQLAAIGNLFDTLAELRAAKVLPTEFLQLPPRDQADFIEDARSRIQPPPLDAPAVCTLDTGVSYEHPLLACAVSQEHVAAVDPNWSLADLKGHGTELAGLSVYGCLTEILSGSQPIVLRHRLESVKILPDGGNNDPELYGQVTSQAVSRAEIADPQRQTRAFCLAVTADGRDEGLPSSWSAAADQITSGASEADAPRRLLLVSAGNVALGERHEYPTRNQVEGIEDPAQSWNALTVGAYTNRASIRSADYEDWRPIAQPGHLSPCSRTSIVWSDKTWPIKPDIVMEGGNNAIDPATGHADYVDDLSLLTTRVSPTGALLTTTGDTSAATALAARYAAIIWSHYPNLAPETVRGLLVHSARWTDAMVQEFPANARHDRLRCYGYGVPDLRGAIWSVTNSATLIVESSLQPFDKVDGTLKTKDMHLHRLPWPAEVLQQLGDIDVRMRITLSYFIEPSPGRRGWTRRHRYQSHGLRFEVKRPLELDDVFHKRISRAAWEEDEQGIESSSDERPWEVGRQLRCKGSIHSDTWTGSAVELAQCGVIAIFPVTGWWRERPHLNCWNRSARYSLIVTIETPAAEVDLYTPIANQIGVPVEVEVDSGGS